MRRGGRHAHPDTTRDTETVGAADASANGMSDRAHPPNPARALTAHTTTAGGQFAPSARGHFTLTLRLPRRGLGAQCSGRR